jgi:hypothetical protein
LEVVHRSELVWQIQTGVSDLILSMSVKTECRQEQEGEDAQEVQWAVTPS